MRKLKLVLEDLQVTSFHPERENAAGRGTVHGRAATDWCPDQRDTYAQCSVYYCGTNQGTGASCMYGAGCEDSVAVCESGRCPYQAPPTDVC
ncbi:MAG TPA: hypothetical protein VJT67_00615 [Longimicrobiaceae bacterium]|nr:hypothetical protein [Longimicrobiaceae bacterium]